MSLTGYVLSDGRDLSNIFMNINNGAVIASQNSFQSKQTFVGGIDLSGSFLYGRNDGSAFDISLNASYPIGYTNTYTTSIASYSSGNSSATYSPTFMMSAGVWIVTTKLSISGITVINAVDPLAIISLPSSTNIIFHDRFAAIYHIPSGATYYSPIFMSTTILIVTAPTTLTINPSFTWSFGATATLELSGGMTVLSFYIYDRNIYRKS